MVVIFVLMLVSMLAATVCADLKPNEVGIVVAEGNRQSAALAKYYAEKRGIPVKNICLISIPKPDVGRPESITSEAWESNVRPKIRAWFDQQNRRETIRCLVTTWGIPIRIESGPADRVSPYLDLFEAEYQDRLDRLNTLIEQIDEMSGQDSSEAGETDATNSGDSRDTAQTRENLASRLARAVTNAQAKAATLGKEEIRSFGAELEQRYVQGVGPAGLYEGVARSLLQKQSPPTPDEVGQRELLRGRILGLSEARGWISQNQLPSLDRDRIELGIIERAGGLLQSLGWLEEKRKTAQKNETLASFDSELSLILWPDYERLRWQTNYLNARASQSMARTHPVIMVSRIDGPTLPIAKRLIDTTLEVEKTGLKGKVYLDARGLDANSTDKQSASFDQQIVQTGEFLEKAGLEVITNSQTELFQPGECPDAALYCGWYSLADYVDAFEWNPGAVAYHVASAEATTLKKAESNVWCKRLLEDGVCATLGPVAEPYLQAFPPPGEFFPTLVSGDFTLVETFYRTKPYNSWMMMLVGDPLYRPFKPQKNAP